MSRNELKIWLEKNILFRDGVIHSKKLNQIPEEILKEIQDYSPKIPLKAQAVYILGEFESLPLCMVCENELPINPKKKEGEWILSSNKYCSKECAQHSLIAKHAREQTLLRRYGAKNIFGSKHGKEKIKRTLREKYGVDNPQKNLEIKAKTVDSLLKRGGVGLANVETQKKAQETYFNRTGFYNPGSNPEVQKKLSKKVDHAQKSHLTEDAKKKIVDIEWLKEQNYRYKKPITQIAKELGVTGRAISQKFHKAGIPLNEEITTSYEQRLLQDFIKSLGIEIKTQVRSILDKKEIDIYIPEKKLAIEYNGLYWHSHLRLKNQNYHLEKTIGCEKKGIQLIHIFSNEWVNKTEIVKSILRAKLGKFDNTLYARKCVIKEVGSKDSREFLNKNHLQGAKTSSVRLGLYHEDLLVSLMTFSKRNKNSDWELDRFCSLLNSHVVGGASKLLSKFHKLYPNESLITYCDRRYSNGDFYKSLGFSLSHISKPNYFYTQDYTKLESRNKYQKHKLGKVLDNFDPSLSGRVNMENNDFDKIYDSGNYVFKK